LPGRLHNNLPPFGSYSGSDFDIVSLQNGNLHISIPILNVPQRGGKPVKYNFVYDTPDITTTVNPPKKGTTHQTTSITMDTLYTGWALRSSLDWGSITQSYASITCFGISTPFQIFIATVIDPDRSQHAMPVLSSLQGTPPCYPLQNSGTALDGSGIFFTSGSPVYEKDGTQPAARDTNGNLSTASADTLNRQSLVVTNGPTVPYTTPLGSTINGQQFQTWTYKDSNGISQNWRLDYTAIDLPDKCGTNTFCITFPTVLLVPQKLTLPTGSLYEFTWNNNSGGELQSVALPSSPWQKYLKIAGGDRERGNVTMVFSAGQ
jgi:hypothetical protein